MGQIEQYQKALQKIIDMKESDDFDYWDHYEESRKIAENALETSTDTKDTLIAKLVNALVMCAARCSDESEERFYADKALETAKEMSGD